ncbi:uncharacterized protein LOC124274185 [Haliotis rubra]|uniref:uncharacterized protein LOC124274185 n=1 Tax=Haliotis rubra TaxID=36100 RepID=UPI001EE62E42|nr:uncharacterized protein LOC124274185 [Haliotis rubra]
MAVAVLQVLSALVVLSGLAQGGPEYVAVFRYPDEAELDARSENCIICSRTPVYRSGVVFRAANDGDVIVLDFVSVAMETSNCGSHYIHVYDGTDYDAPLLETVCDSQKIKVRSTGSTMALYYTYWDFHSSFRLKYYSYEGPNSSSSSLPASTIVGIVVGAIVVVIILAAVGVCLSKKNDRKTNRQRNRNRNSRIGPMPSAPPAAATVGRPGLSYPLNYTNHAPSDNHQPSPFEKAAIQGLQSYNVPPPAFSYNAPPPYDQHASYPH